MKVALVRWIPALLMMTLIFAFSSIPSSEMPDFSWADLIVKKGGHMLGYALLAAAFCWAMARNAWSHRIPVFPAWLLAVLYAVSDEFHQSFVPGRNASPVDVLIDAVGAGIGLAVMAWLTRRREPATDERR